MPAAILHVDADSFFASVAMRTRPQLRQVPFAVVAHTYIASANYPARDRGVRSAMLTWEALAVCPELVLLDVDRGEVERVSDDLFDIFGRHAVSVEPGSLEEAFLDVKAQDGRDAADKARALRADVEHRIGITVSVGIGRTKLMAKLASRRAKPDGIHEITPAAERRLRDALPLTDVWGVGAKTLERLRLSGYATVGELATAPPDELRRICGLAMARRLTAIREGTNDAVVRGLERRSSLSSEGTIAGYGRPDLLAAELLQQCLSRVCHRAARAGMAAATLSLSVRIADARPLPPAKVTVTVPGNDSEFWLPEASALLGRHRDAAVTGMKVTLSGLTPVVDVLTPLF